MEVTDTEVTDTEVTDTEVTSNVDLSEKPVAHNNKLAIIGFALMVAGPVTLFLAGLLQNRIGNLSELTAQVIMWVTIVLPGIGVIFSIISLIMKKAGKLGRVLTVVTLIMCNPLFYFCYLLICAFVSSMLAGLPGM